MSARSVTGIVFAVAAFSLGLLFASSLWWVRGVRSGLLGAAKAELRGVVAQWNTVGQPRGEELDKFLSRIPPYIYVTNQHFIIDGTAIEVVFATARTGLPATVCISTGGVVIILEPNSHPKIMR
jgi:hypothetical protein